jgi:hypothetical protein
MASSTLAVDLNLSWKAKMKLSPNRNGKTLVIN